MNSASIVASDAGVLMFKIALNRSRILNSIVVRTKINKLLDKSFFEIEKTYKIKAIKNFEMAWVKP